MFWDVKEQKEQEPLEKALKDAVYEDKIDLVRQLIQEGAGVNTQDYKGRTPMFWAKSDEVVKLLIEEGADVNAKDDDGWTPIFYAAEEKIERARTIIEILVENGADINAKNNDGLTALQLAYDDGYDDTVELLKEFGAK